MKSLLCLFALAVPSFGAVSFSLPGTSESASWTLNSAAHPGFNSFGTAANPWVSTVSPDAGSASAVFNKTGGSGYIGGSFLYTAGTDGFFSISDSSPLASLQTLVLQGSISDAFNSIPVLNINGGSQAISPDFAAIFTGSSYSDRVWQWDLTSVAGPITSYEILFDGHFAATSLSVDSSNSYLQVIPEPSTGLLGMAAMGLSLVRRRRA